MGRECTGEVSSDSTASSEAMVRIGNGNGNGNGTGDGKWQMAMANGKWQWQWQWQMANGNAPIRHTSRQKHVCDNHLCNEVEEEDDGAEADSNAEVDLENDRRELWELQQVGMDQGDAHGELLEGVCNLRPRDLNGHQLLKGVNIRPKLLNGIRAPHKHADEDASEGKHPNDELAAHVGAPAVL